MGIFISIVIASSHRDFLLKLSDWFKSKEMSTSISSPKVSTPQIQIAAEKSIRKFIESVLPHACLKKRQLEIILDAVNLRAKLRQDKKRTISGNEHLFNEYREELHSLARKGPKTLKRL